jgi:hypothetical protein
VWFPLWLVEVRVEGKVAVILVVLGAAGSRVLLAGPRSVRTERSVNLAVYATEAALSSAAGFPRSPCLLLARWRSGGMVRAVTLAVS